MNKRILKELQTWFRKEYSGLVEAYQNNKLTEEDLQHYLETVPNSFEVLDNYKKNQERNTHIENYKKVVKNDVVLAEQLKEQASNTLKLLIEELEMTSKDQALEPTKALNKYNKMRKLEKKIDEAYKTIDMLESLIEELQPPKRKPGRPKKQKDTQESVSEY